MKDEEDRLVLGSLAVAQQSKEYTQQFTSRGHPTNPATERLFQKFCNAQNEVLAACGVVVRKDINRKRNQNQKRVPNSVQVEQLDSENKIGFMVKVCDRVSGNLASWWLDSLRHRQMVHRIAV